MCLYLYDEWWAGVEKLCWLVSPSWLQSRHHLCPNFTDLLVSCFWHTRRSRRTLCHLPVAINQQKWIWRWRWNSIWNGDTFSRHCHYILVEVAHQYCGCEHHANWLCAKLWGIGDQCHSLFYNSGQNCGILLNSCWPLLGLKLMVQLLQWLVTKFMARILSHASHSNQAFFSWCIRFSHKIKFEPHRWATTMMMMASQGVEWTRRIGKAPGYAASGESSWMCQGERVLIIRRR